MKYYLDHKYYHLIASLPELHWGNPCPTSCEDYFDMLSLELCPQDLDIIWTLRLKADIENILRPNTTWQTGGQFSKTDIVKWDKHKEIFPQFMVRYFEASHSAEETDIAPQKRLMEDYFAEIERRATPNLQAWLNNERAIVNSIYAIKNTNRISQLPDQLLAGGFELETLSTGPDGLKELGYEWLTVHEIVNIMKGTEVVARERDLDAIRWEFIDTQMLFEYFSIDAIIAYTLKIMLLDRWQKLDKETGKALLDKNIIAIRDNYLHTISSVNT